MVGHHAVTQPFDLSDPEHELYTRVTDYINEFLPKVSGKKRTSVALARIVFQRRLASSLGAITSSLERRHKRFADMLRELEGLPGSQRAKKLADFRLIEIADVEQEEDDETEEQQDLLIDSTVAVETMEKLADEVRELARLVKLARETLALGKEEKLEALKRGLERAEFAELRDGRGIRNHHARTRVACDPLTTHNPKEGSHHRTNISPGTITAVRRETRVEATGSAA